MIKIACYSDTHGTIPSPIKEEGLAAYFHAGDWYGAADLKSKAEPTPAMLAVKEWVKSRQVPIFTVAGNHDCNDNAKIFHSCQNVTCDCLPFVQPLPRGRIKIVGVGWAGEKHFELPLVRDMKEACLVALQEATRRYEVGDRFILLTHYMPWFPQVFTYKKNNREGWAFDCIADLVRVLKPLAVIFGHIHELLGKQVPYSEGDLETLLICAGPKGGILSIDSQQVSFERNANVQ